MHERLSNHPGNFAAKIHFMQIVICINFLAFLTLVSLNAFTQENNIEFNNVTVTTNLFEQLQKESGRYITTFKGAFIHSGR